MSLRIENLTIHIDDQVVVDDLSLHVERGNRIGLIGESGSGKSLTALAVLGLLPEGASASGSIRVNGNEVLGCTERELAQLRGRDVGMVFQEPRTALDPVRRVGVQIAESLRIHEHISRRAARDRAVELAALVALPDPGQIVDLYPHQLSGGQRQRVAIAGALANSPALLIADEPTTALDVTVQAGVLDLFDRVVAETGTALVFITHDLAVLGRIAEQAIVLAHGRVVEEGDVVKLVGHPAHPVTAGLAAAARATAWTLDPEATG